MGRVHIAYPAQQSLVSLWGNSQHKTTVFLQLPSEISHLKKGIVQKRLNSKCKREKSGNNSLPSQRQPPIISAGPPGPRVLCFLTQPGLHLQHCHTSTCRTASLFVEHRTVLVLHVPSFNYFVLLVKFLRFSYSERLQ